MPIRFTPIFKNAESSTLTFLIDPVDDDVSLSLPDLSEHAPEYMATFGNYGFCSKVYYARPAFEILFLNGLQTTFSYNMFPSTGNDYMQRLCAIPMYNYNSTTPACYFGVRIVRQSSSGSNWSVGISCGFYTTPELTTSMSSNSATSNSVTVGTQDTMISIGVSFFPVPGRTDPSRYPYEWQKYIMTVYYARSRYWTGETFQVKATTADATTLTYLEPDSGSGSFMWFIDYDKFWSTTGYAPYQSFDSNYSPEAGPSSGPGGYHPSSSNFDDSSDTIGIPADPSIGVTNVGFVNVYKTSSGGLQNMGIELFPDLQYTAPTSITATDVTDAIVNGFNQIATFLANIPSFFEQITASTLINYIIDCHVIPVTPSGGTSERIKVGFKQLSTSGLRLTNDYVTFPCGSISLSEYYTNFADFLTTAKLYLPFVGFVPCQPEWFYREQLTVTYKFNIVDGSFMAYVQSTGAYVNNNNVNGTIIAQYGGNACVHLPITGVTYASMVSGLVGAGAGAVMAAGSGNIAAAASSAVAVAGAHGDIAASNQYSSTVSFLGVRRPYLMIERPVSSFSKTYAKELGVPSNISKELGSVTGFNVIGDVHLDGINATDREKVEIERLLHEGVIL